MRPLEGVEEHWPDQVDGQMACKRCGQSLLSVKFGVWLIWLSLETGQICKGGSDGEMVAAVGDADLRAAGE